MSATIMMVTYNRLDLTKKTLEHLFNVTKYPFNLVVVDNASKDDTVEYLNDFCNSVKIDNFKFKIKTNSENKGIGIGRNQCLAISEVPPFDTKWLATLDNDVLVPEGWLTECISIITANPQYGSIGVNMENTQYPIVNLNGVEFQNKPRGNLGTACTVFNRSLHKMIGFFNHTDYGKYGEEDADWGMRTRVIGFKLGYIKQKGTHLGEDEYDTGEYRDFKTSSHKNNLAKFNKNCSDYVNGKKSLNVKFNYKDYE